MNIFKYLKRIIILLINDIENFEKINNFKINLNFIISILL